MLKKKAGGLAFKPKIPSARSRPANVPSAPAPKSVESQPLVDSTREAASTGAPTNPEKDVPETGNARSIEPPTEESLQEDAEPGQSRTEPEPSQDLLPPASSVAQNASEPPASLVPDVQDVPDIANDSIAAQADTGTQPAADDEAATASTLEPAINTSCATALEPLSLSSAERSPIEAACSEAPSQPPADEAVPPAPDLSIPSQSAPEPSSAPDPAHTTTTTEDPPISKGRTTRKPRQAKKGGQSKDPPQKRQRKKATKEGEEATPRPRKRTRKADTDADATEPTQAEKKKKRGRARSPTPEDAESQTVDLQQLRMADLTKDLRIGKKFSRHDELRDRERKKARSRAKASQQAEGTTTTTGDSASTPQQDGSQNPSDKNNNDSNASGSSSAPTTGSQPPTTSGPQFRIIDGQIVIDQNSLVMDRHARAAQARGDLETVEENDFTRHITSSSFMTTSKLKGPNIWTAEETELFYRGLRMFGTEFEMISKMFPGKQRRHVKLKFNREERHNPSLIDAALIGEKTTKMDIDEYRAFTGAEFEPVESIEAEQRKIGERYELERQRIADEQAETMRKKKEALFADDDDDGARRKRHGNRRKGRQTVAYGLNGEPINAAE
ncbi:hypothetical protein CP532_7051 [Ophiocordyceps camponoti-leonardi (nom. inval.)]|nr:hypothetical protein CP532_7051 [Ophiocordyceps camponoti-leonardi (nom. inval.)]